MGTRWIIPVKCPNCGHEDEAYYAPSCGFTTWQCPECKKEYAIEQNFLLLPLGDGEEPMDN